VIYKLLPLPADVMITLSYPENKTSPNQLNPNDQPPNPNNHSIFFIFKLKNICLPLGEILEMLNLPLISESQVQAKSI
jgi:hypothetical protein